MSHEPQNTHRLWWVATYHDGSAVYESEQAGEISSEDINRVALKRFSLVDADGIERFGLDFPDGDDPKLVYRRRTFNSPKTVLPEPYIRDENGYEIPNPDCPETIRDRPDWLTNQWTYILGYHHADNRLELWGMNAAGEFNPEPAADVQLVPCEQFLTP